MTARLGLWNSIIKFKLPVSRRDIFKPCSAEPETDGHKKRLQDATTYLIAIWPSWRSESLFVSHWLFWGVFGLETLSSRTSTSSISTIRSCIRTFFCHTGTLILRSFRPCNTCLKYLYNKIMYSYIILCILNLLVKLEMLVSNFRNFRCHNNWILEMDVRITFQHFPHICIYEILNLLIKPDARAIFEDFPLP